MDTAEPPEIDIPPLTTRLDDAMSVPLTTKLDDAVSVPLTITLDDAINEPPTKTFELVATLIVVSAPAMLTLDEAVRVPVTATGPAIERLDDVIEEFWFVTVAYNDENDTGVGIVL